ncbi:MAG: Glyoxalase/bleomycin resistance protein/dioxygenase [Acidimicrobiaceae bacterium]|nr:Glyoxalase/bleomycin resistance protein/dioxygenase [Acidimicrobiaceae bacterium]
MTTRDATVPGTPCWADLSTSDVEGSRRFYAELFGWEPLAPNPDFGGYFNFSRNGAWVAGGMGDMGEDKADDTWKPYLATSDIEKTLAAAQGAGGHVLVPPVPVADLGVLGMLQDPSGAIAGLWQAGSWPGSEVVGEPGTPSWFELHTPDLGAAVAFYRELFGYDAISVSDTEEFRYSSLRLPGDDTDIAGVYEDSSLVGGNEAPHWEIYWEVEDVDAGVATVESLGGRVLEGASSTPYGRIASVTDPHGARFKLRSTPA